MGIFARALIGGAIGAVISEGFMLTGSKVFSKRLEAGVDRGDVFRVHSKQALQNAADAGQPLNGKSIENVNFDTHHVLRLELNNAGVHVMYAYPRSMHPFIGGDDYHLRLVGKWLMAKTGVGFTDDRVTKAMVVIGEVEVSGAEKATVTGTAEEAAPAAAEASVSAEAEVVADAEQPAPIVVDVKGTPSDDTAAA